MSQDEKTDEAQATANLLAKIEVFEGLPTEHLRRIIEIGKEVSYKRNETIFQEGDESGALYVVLAGKVRISREVPGMGEEALAVLGPEAYFGEMSLIDSSPRSASAIANERCKVFALEKQDFLDLLFVDKSLAYEVLWSFLRTLARRLRATNDKMTFLATTSRF